ncbi:hypothetical protein VZT92_023739 [Zoarces viviparus]|uniref:Uncharacterized protein n=1 Tax=Zoarces viviparus TaxID=48416 RepID=A0AAW1E897_ZOAVI
MLSPSLSPARQLQRGYFLPRLLVGLAWRQPLGPGELGGPDGANAAIRPLTSQGKRHQEPNTENTVMASSIDRKA